MKALRRTYEGHIKSIRPTPHDPGHALCVDIIPIGESAAKTLLVEQSYWAEHQLSVGEIMHWQVWTIPGMNFILNPVLDVTKYNTQNNRRYHKHR